MADMYAASCIGGMSTYYIISERNLDKHYKAVFDYMHARHVAWQSDLDPAIRACVPPPLSHNKSCTIMNGCACGRISSFAAILCEVDPEVIVGG